MDHGTDSFWFMHANAEQFRAKFSSAAMCNLSEESDLQVPWEYDALLDLYWADNGPIRIELLRKRALRIVKFVCEKCSTGDHTECRGGTWCDCQHMGRK